MLNSSRISNVEKIEPAYDFDHQGNMDDWLIIEKSKM